MIRYQINSKKYGKETIIANSDLCIESNKVSFLMGANGAGKTTFIKCALNMETFDGCCSFDGQPIDAVRADMLVIWDDCPFYLNLSGIDNLSVFAEKSVPVQKLAEIASEYLEAELLKRKVRTYSYGQKKKLALILVELLKPRYLFMDEISNGLDYESMLRLKTSIRKWSKSMNVFLTGHQFNFYNDITDNLLLFKGNEIVLYADDLKKREMKLEDVYDREIRKA